MWRDRANRAAQQRRRPPSGQAVVSTWVAAMHRQAPGRVLALGTFLLLVVVVADGISGPHYSFSIFYLLVVIRVSATGHRSYLVPAAVVTAATWTGVEAWNRRLDDPWLPLIWNSAARFAVLYICALLVAATVSAARHEREVSRTDALTGLHNRRGFCDLAGLELARAERSGGGLSLLYLDVDGFKDVNDRQGHAAGDDLLKQVGRVLDSTVRQYDTVARVGGDEFVALLPGTGGAEAVRVAHRAADHLDEMCRRDGWPVHVSIGVATFVDPPRTVDDLLEAADGLMYAAKREGSRSRRSTVRAHLFLGTSEEAASDVAPRAGSA